MKTALSLAVTTALLSAFIWRQGVSSFNNLVLPRLPDSYTSLGSGCSIITADDRDAFRSCEDVTFWDSYDKESHLKSRKVIVSCDKNRHQWNTVMGPLRDPVGLGSLWVYDPSEPERKPIRLTLENYPHNAFHPLGIEVSPLRDSAHNSYLYVINHMPKKTVVDQFAISAHNPFTARYVRTLWHPKFVAPNSLALTSPTSFYVTNDHYFTRRLRWPLGEVLPILESLLAIPLAELGHVTVNNDGSITYETVKKGNSFPNGVSLTHDAKTLAVAATSLGRVQFYRRDQITKELHLEQEVSVPFAPDNIAFDHEDTLIVAGHPHFPSLIRAAADPSKTHGSPSWIVSLKKGNGSDTETPVPIQSRVTAPKGYHMKTIYQSNGQHFCTSTTGVRDETSGVVYGTGLYQEGLLVCKP